MNFTSRVWWTLIEEIALRAEEMAGEKEMACCVRGYYVYKDYGQQQFGKCWCVAWSQNIFICFLCTKIFLQRK